MAEPFEKEKSNDLQDSYEPPKFDYCVLEESKQNPALGSFFSSLNAELVSLKAKEAPGASQSLGQTFELLKKYNEETNKLEQELVQSGITLGKEKSFVFFPTSNLSEIIKLEPIRIKTYKSFNGLDLSKEDILNHEQLREKYEEKRAFCDTLVSEEKSLIRKLARLKTKLSISPFRKTDTEELIRRTEARLYEIDMAFSEEEYIANQLKTFESIPKQKMQLVGKYIDAANMLEKSIQSYEDGKDSLISDSYKYSSEMVEEATRRVIINSEMTENQISKVFESLDEVKQKINAR